MMIRGEGRKSVRFEEEGERKRKKLFSSSSSFKRVQKSFVGETARTSAENLDNSVKKTCQFEANFKLFYDDTSEVKTRKKTRHT